MNKLVCKCELVVNLRVGKHRFPAGCHVTPREAPSRADGEKPWIDPAVEHLHLFTNTPSPSRSFTRVKARHEM